jgi:hypothetical protein
MLLGRKGTRVILMVPDRLTRGIFEPRCTVRGASKRTGYRCFAKFNSLGHE